MRATVSRSDFKNALTKLGVAPGRIVAVISDLVAFGDLETEDQSDPLSGYLDCFLELMGEGGTLAVPTFTFVRPGNDNSYIHEQTASETGTFTEFIRNVPGSLRSIHPVLSVTAIGDAKSAICANTSGHSYGWNSPSQRLVEADALVIGLGRSPHRGSFLVHFAEMVAGVPYRYTKKLDIPTYVNGKLETRPFFHFVKYREADLAWDTNRLVDRLDARGQLRFVPLGLSGIWAYPARDFFDTTVSLLNRNIFSLMAHPPTKTPWTL